MSFDIREYQEQLVLHPTHRNAYLCPACETGKLTFAKDNGAFTCWTNNCSSKAIRDALNPPCNPHTGLTEQEITERKQAAAEARERQQQEQAKAYDEAGQRAQEEWAAAVPLTDADPVLVEASYWTHKGLQPIPDVRIAVEGEHRGKVLVPMFLPDGTLRNLQRISPDGQEKRNVRKAQKSGCVGILGSLTNAEVIAIAEGPATAGSIHQLMGWPTLIGFGHSGFPSAAAMARGKAPNARLVICADNDANEAGQRAAAPLAREYGAVLIMPPRPSSQKKRDFNDMHQTDGDEAMRNLLNDALKASPGEPEAVAEPSPEQPEGNCDMNQSLDRLRKLKHDGQNQEVLRLARQMVTATAALEKDQADYWLKVIARITGQRTADLRDMHLQAIRARQQAQAAERQARLETEQREAIKEGLIDDRFLDRFLPIRLCDTDDCLHLFPADNWLTLGPNADLRLASMQQRRVHLCWADVFNPKVQERLAQLAEALTNMGAVIRVEVLPQCLETGRPLTIADTVERFGPQFLQRLPQLARNCWTETRDGRVFRLEPDAENTAQRSEYVAGMLGNQLVADPSLSRTWLTYTGTHWMEHPNDKEIRSRLQKLAASQGWRKCREIQAFNSLVDDVTRSLTRELTANHHGLIPMRNGMLRLSDGQLLPHSPDYGNRWCLPFEYHPNASAEPVVEFMRERLGGEHRLRLFHAWLTLLLRGIRPKAFVELVGDSDTGKSTLCNLVAALVGDQNVTSTDLQRLENKNSRFETYRLRNKLLVIISEAHKYSGPLEVLKALTGGDLISAEIKGSTGKADFYFEGGVLIAGNGFLHASDSSDAVLKRRMSFELGRVQGKLRDLIHWDSRKSCWAGEFVEYLPGFFNWALSMSEAEAREILDKRHLDPTLWQDNAHLRIDQDPLLAWANANLILATDFSGHLRIGDLSKDDTLFAYPNYRCQCEREGVKNPVTLKTFRTALISRLRSCGARLPEDKSAYRIRNQGSIIPGFVLRNPSDTTSPYLLEVLSPCPADPANADEVPETEPASAEGTSEHEEEVHGPEPTNEEEAPTQEEETPGMDQDDGGTDRGTAEPQAGDGWKGWNGLLPLTITEADESKTTSGDSLADNGQEGDDTLHQNSSIGESAQEPVPSIPSIPHQGFSHSPSVPQSVPGVPSVPEADDLTVRGANPWGLTPEQVTVAYETLRANPGISDGALEMKLRGKGIRLCAGQIGQLRQWLSGEVA